MRICLATAHPYLPEICGGAQSSIHEMAGALSNLGHDVAVLSGLSGEGAFGVRRRIKLKFSRSKTVRDDSLGYPVFRGWFPWEAAQEVVRQFDPDIVVPHSGLPVKVSRAFAELGVPTIIYFRNVEMDDLGGPVQGSADAFLANSEFTAHRVKARHGVNAQVIPPLFEAERYRVQSSRRFITFINPHPYKGRDIAFDLARSLPEEEFLFVRAWTLNEEDEERLARISEECKNVVVRDRTSDMREVYSETKVVIAPSQWEEAWGRIASEAHFSGIPVIASAVGGLTESVGPGGVLLPPDAGSAQWKDAVRRICIDEDYYDRLARAALEYSRRPEMKKEVVLDWFVSAANRVVRQYSAPATGIKDFSSQPSAAQCK